MASYKPISNSDDGYIYVIGSVFNNSATSAYMGVGSAPYYTFIRFPSISIPKLATITSASLTFYAAANGTGLSAITIYANDVDNAVAPTNYSNYWTKVTTQAYSSWNMSNFTSGNSYTWDQSIVEVIQEIVNRDGWTQGNALMLLLSGSGSYSRSFKTRESSATQCPTLDITFTSNATVTTPAVGITTTAINPSVTSTSNATVECACILLISDTIIPIVDSYWGTITKLLSYTQYLAALSVTEYNYLLTFIEYQPKLEVVNMPLAGSTIILKATFTDSTGTLIDLDGVVAKVYGPGKTLLETISLVTRASQGVYTASYTIPASVEGQLDYEFAGALSGKEIVGRSSFDSNWK